MAYDKTRNALNKEAVAAAELIRELGSDDAELSHDMIEGETEFFEAVEAALNEIDECDLMTEGLKAHIAKLNDRLTRIKNRSERLRGLIDQAFQMAEVESHKFTTATITTKKVPPKLIVTQEADLPAKFWEAQPPKLNKKAVQDALKDGETVPGASLSNGGTTIQIRRA